MAGSWLPRRKAAWLTVLAIILTSLSHAAGQTIDSCPANSPHKALPFLKNAKPEAIGALVGTGSTLSVNMNAVTDFVKTTLVPMIGANVFFFALAALFLVIFILWRLLRFCCYIICCRGSCDAKREQNNVYELLFSKRMKVLKGFMFLFGLVAIVFAIYGMATAGKQKDIITPAFGVIGTLNNYFDHVSGDVNQLMATISNVTGIIDQFEALMTTDVDVNGLIQTLQAIGAFLDATPNPPSVTTDFTNLGTALTNFRGATGALQQYIDGVPAFNTARTNLNAKLAILNSAPTTIGVIQAGAGSVNDVQAKLTAAPLGGVGGYWSLSSTANPSTSDFTTLQTAVHSFDTNRPNWITSIDSIAGAITYVTDPTKDPFKALISLAQGVQSAVANLITSTSNLSANLGTMKTANTNILPQINFLSQKLVYINTTILDLTGTPIQTAYDQLETANSSAAAVYYTTPSPISNAVTQLGALQTALVTLQSSMASTAAGSPGMQLAIEALATPSENDMTTLFPAASVTSYQTLLATLRANLGGSSTPATTLSTFRTALDGYIGATPGATWAALLSAYTPYSAVISNLNAALPGATVPTVVSTFAASATTTTNDGNAVDTASGSSPVNTASSNCATAKNDNTLSTSGITLGSDLSSVVGAYNTLKGSGTAYSNVVIAPEAQLANLKSSTITAGDNAKQQINASVSSVNSSVANMKNMLLGKLTKVQTQYEPTDKQYDGYRYSASMALYGISILFVGLMFLSAYLNYHFGANLSTFVILIITVLYFLLAVIIALLISVLFLGCGDMEHLILQFASQLSPTYAPVLTYYFGSDSTLTLKSVLKSANLVDIDAMIAQIVNSQGTVLSSLSGSWTFKSKPLTILGGINGTIAGIDQGVNTLLTTVGRDGMIPVYGDVKGLVCCLVPDFLSSMWIGLTFAGIFAFALIFCTFFYIGKLDKTPRKDCCGCTCHTPAKYAGTVFPDTLPQFQAPGFENPMGPYDAPNGAYFGEPTVVVNAPGVKKAV